MFNFSNDDFVEIELSEKLLQKVIDHRNNFFKITVGRYMEMLPSQFILRNCPDSWDYIKTETALLFNNDLAIGETTNGNISLLGYIKNRNTLSSIEMFLTPYRCTKDDIIFTIPEELQAENYLEITTQDDAKTGNFIAYRNKGINLISDYNIIRHYATALAEIEGSRYSLEIQAKVMSVLKGEKGNETINQIVTDLFNGSPAIKVDPSIDLEELFFKVDNSNLASTLVELKSDLQNRFSELDTLVGLPNLAVDKKSGVSDIEANGNDDKTASVAQIKLSVRQQQIKLLKARYPEKLGDLEIVLQNDIDDSTVNENDTTSSADENNPEKGVNDENNDNA